MTDEQIRLYAIARCVVPAGTRIRTFREPIAAGSGILYTLELNCDDAQRWFGVHSDVLRDRKITDETIASQIGRALVRPGASPAPAG